VTLALIIALAAFIAAAFAAGYHAGGSAAKKTLMQRDVEAAKRISDAREVSPSNADALAERLRRGGKL